MNFCETSFVRYCPQIDGYRSSFVEDKRWREWRWSFPDQVRSLYRIVTCGTQLRSSSHVPEPRLLKHHNDCEMVYTTWVTILTDLHGRLSLFPVVISTYRPRVLILDLLTIWWVSSWLSSTVWTEVFVWVCRVTKCLNVNKHNNQSVHIFHPGVSPTGTEWVSSHTDHVTILFHDVLCIHWSDETFFYFFGKSMTDQIVS